MYGVKNLQKQGDGVELVLAWGLPCMMQSKTVVNWMEFARPFIH